jgi:hypothetical protein
MRYPQLEEKLNVLGKTDPRNAAEHAYALAMLNKRVGDNDKAVKFGREALAHLNKCRLESASDCATINVVIEGIALPEFIHQEVVRDRLAPLTL